MSKLGRSIIRRGHRDSEKGDAVTVNFIADPWEWNSLGPMKIGDLSWITAYQEFKTRLHWLLLWNDEVQIVDSIVLFNRQFEQWFCKAKDRSGGREALEKVFEEKALRIALRKDQHREFASLTEIDAEQVRGNPEFRWFYDGAPSQDFVSDLDAYLGLPSPRYPIRYEGWRRPNRMRDCFVAALERNSDFEAIYREFQLLREGLPVNIAEDLRSVPGDNWRRSELYTRLGYGLDQRGQVVQKQADLAELPDQIRGEILRLINWSWYFAIHEVIRSSTRFPGEAPLAALYQMFPPSRFGLTRDQEEEEARWLQGTLQDVDVGSVRLEGDVYALLDRLKTFDLEDFWTLRQTSVFKNYRQLYADFEAAGPRALDNHKLCRSVVNAKFRCLVELGNKCEVRITQSGLGSIMLKFLAQPAGAKIIAWGIGLVPAILMGIPSVAGVLDRPIVWLSARVQHIGTRERPLRAKVRYIGPIRTSD